MLIFAHRGLHTELTENTMAAFEAAVLAGVDGIETDVRLSADGLPVIMHDRVTRTQRPVAELTRVQLEREVGHAVPLLGEILEAFPDTLWNIEIKTPKALPASVAVLRQFQQRRKLLVTSFRHDLVRAAARALDVDCGLLLAERPLDVPALVSATRREARIRACVWDYNIVDEAALQTMLECGWDNYIYGAITDSEHEHCASLGLAGLITDYPLKVKGEGGRGKTSILDLQSSR